MGDDKKNLTSSKKSATRQVMDMISRREYSEKELEDRLTEKGFAEKEIFEALQNAKEKKWLNSPEYLSEQLALQLHKKNKGIEFINATLTDKGLPHINRDESFELEKALSLVKTKYSRFAEFSRDEKLKAARFLASRGFDSSTIEKVFHDEEF